MKKSVAEQQILCLCSPMCINSVSWRYSVRLLPLSWQIPSKNYLRWPQVRQEVWLLSGTHRSVLIRRQFKFHHIDSSLITS